MKAARWPSFSVTPEQWALVAALPLNQVSGSALNTVVGPFRTEFGLSYSELGLVLTSYGLARLLSNVPVGFMVRRFNVRIVLLASLLANVLAAGLCIGASAPWHVVASRMVQGMCSAVVQASILAWLLITVAPAVRGRVMSLSESCFALAGLLVPVGTGLLAITISWRAAFVMAVIGAGAAFVAVLVATKPESVPELSRAGASQSAHAGSALGLALSTGGAMLLIAYVLTFVDSLNRFGMVNTLLPLLGSDGIGLSPLQIAAGLALANIVGIGVLTAGGRAGDQYGRARLVLPGLLVVAMCQCAVLAISGQASYFAIVGLQGLAFFMGSFTTSLIGDALPAHLRSIGVTGYRLMVDGALLLAPVVVGLLIDWRGFSAPIGLMLGVTLTGLLAVALLLRLSPSLATGR